MWEILKIALPLVLASSAHAVNLLADRIMLEHYSAKYSCMTKLDPVSSRLLKEEMDSMINSNMYDQYFEDCLVQMIMFHDFQLFCQDIAGMKWSEIDMVDDLLEAQEIHREAP